MEKSLGIGQKNSKENHGCYVVNLEGQEEDTETSCLFK
jgi:hypothetical protein